MARKRTTTYLLLDGHQGFGPEYGWRIQELHNLDAGVTRLNLAPEPAPPVPLKDDIGSLGGLEAPTGVAVRPGGDVYVSDSKKNAIFKITRREGQRIQAVFYRPDVSGHSSDRFVYVPQVNRVELWPGALGRDPRSLDETIIICETAWNEELARRAILEYLRRRNAEPECSCPKCAGHSRNTSCGCCPESKRPANSKIAIDETWKGDYPESLPSAESCKSSIECLPCLGGGGKAPRLFDQPRGLAVSPVGDLYVADTGNHRVQVFALNTLVLRAIWGKRASSADAAAASTPPGCGLETDTRLRAGDHIPGSAPGQFNEPWDVAADRSGHVFVADRGNHRVQRYDCDSRLFVVIDGTVLAAHYFKVLYGPRSKERFVFIPARSRLEQWPASLGHDPANPGETIPVPGSVASSDRARDLVLELINAIGSRDILVEWDAAYPAHLGNDTPFEHPSHLAVDDNGRLYVVDDDKDYVKVLDGSGRVIGMVTYASDVAGRFRPTAVAVDSEGRLVLAGGAGVRCYVLEDGRCVSKSWLSELSGDCASVAVDSDGLTLIAGDDGLVQLHPPLGFLRKGTYLSQALDSQIEKCAWHKFQIEFEKEIPLGCRVTVLTHTSEESRTLAQLQALGEVEWHTGQANANDFLILSPPGRYLWFKMEFRGNGADTPRLNQVKVHFPRDTYLQYLPAIYQADPVSKDFLERFLSIFETTVLSIEGTIDTIEQYFDPDGVPFEFLDWLASWVDMFFDQNWSEETRRRLLRNAPELYRRRGTPEGLLMMIKLALDIDARILEHFKLRRWLIASADSVPGDRSQLWGDCVVSRLQIGENSRVGDFALVGTGDPARDPFHVYAHSFSLFIPEVKLLSESTERSLRTLVEREKPAHTLFDLVKVQPRFRVGVQATLGLDTLLGTYPQSVLGHCSTLGYDTVLGCAPQDVEHPMMEVGRRALVGVSTVVG